MSRLRRLNVFRQGRLRCSWRSLFATLGVLIAAELVVMVAALMLVLPAYLSDRYQIWVTLQVMQAPADVTFPISGQFEQDQDLRSIHCTHGGVDQSEALYLLDCTYLAKEVSDGTRYLKRMGFTFGNRYANFGVSPVMGQMGNQAIIAVFAIVLWGVWLRVFKHSLVDDLKNAWHFLKTKYYWVVLPCVLAFAMSFIVAYLFPSTLAKQATLDTDLAKLKWVIVSALLVAPVFEEVVFRGWVLDILQKRMRWWLAALPATLSFAGMHLLPTEVPLAGYAVYVVFGFSLCWLRQASSSLSLCVFVHALYNAMALLLMAVTSGAPSA